MAQWVRRARVGGGESIQIKWRQDGCWQAPARRLAARHGLTRSVTPHMLRHTTVVWSLAEGVPIQVVSEMIGHSSPQMTYDVYGGLINLRDPVMAQAMARAMLIGRHAVLPRVLPEDVNRPQRPGRRGESRRRAS